MLVRWQPFQEVEEVRRQFDRLFRDMTTIDKDAEKGAWVPASELRDDGDHLTLRLSLPDIDAVIADKISEIKAGLFLAHRYFKSERFTKLKVTTDHKELLWNQILIGI